MRHRMKVRKKNKQKSKETIKYENGLMFLSKSVHQTDAMRDCVT